MGLEPGAIHVWMGLHTLLCASGGQRPALTIILQARPRFFPGPGSLTSLALTCQLG